MTDLGALQVELTAKGLPELLNALKSISTAVETLEKKVKASNAAQIKGSQNVAQQYLKAEAQKTQDTKREIDKREKEYQILFNTQEQLIRKQVLMEQQATRMMSAEFTKRGEAQMQAIRKVEAAQNASGRRMLTAVGRGGQRMFQTGGLMLGGAAAYGAGSFLHSAFGQAMDLESTVGHVIRASNVPNKSLLPKGYVPMTHAEVTNESRRMGNELGVDPTEIAKGYLTIAQHGRPDLAKAFGSKIAKWSFAEDIPTEDLADTLQTFARQNPKASNVDLEKMMMHVMGQGKQFNIPVSEMAKQVGVATSAASMFSTRSDPHKMMATQNELAALMQIAMAGGAVGAPTAGMAVKSTFADLLKVSNKKLAKHGLSQSDITDKAGNLLGPNTILESLIAKTHGSAKAIEDIMGQKGLKLVSGLLPTYAQAEANKPGSGLAAVDAMLRQTEALMTNNTKIEQDIVERKRSEPLQQATQKIQNALSEAIVRNFPDIVDAIHFLEPILTSLPATIATVLMAPALGSGLGAAMGNMFASTVQSLSPGWGTAFGSVAGAMILASFVVGIEKWTASQLKKDPRLIDPTGTIMDPNGAGSKYGRENANGPLGWLNKEMDREFNNIGKAVIDATAAVEGFTKNMKDAAGDPSMGRSGTAGPKGANLPGTHK